MDYSSGMGHPASVLNKKRNSARGLFLAWRDQFTLVAPFSGRRITTQSPLGIEMEEMHGHFWGFHETRPYMRAKAGLVNALLFDKQTLEAVGHLWHMLELNTSDNQGMRYILSTALLDTGNLNSYAGLLKRFPDDTMSAWLYNHALYLFRLHGDSPESTAKVYEAIDRNRHIPALLVGKKKMPTESFDYVVLGDVSEAAEYVRDNQRLWGLTRNAMDWLWDIAKK